MLASSWPGPLAALLAVPYLATVWPYRSVARGRDGADAHLAVGDDVLHGAERV
jgi:hypothetical protein